MKNNSIYLFIAVFALLLSCNQESSNIVEDDFFTVSNIDLPPEEIEPRKSVSGCSDTWVTAFYGGASMQDANNQFLRCIRDIAGAGNITGIGDGPKYIEHISPGGTTVPVFQQFLVPGNLQELIVYAGVKEATTTQDSVNKFMQAFAKCNDVVANAGPLFMSTDLKEQLDYAHKQLSYFSFYSVAGGIVYPAAGYKYLISFNAGTLKIPTHWPEYGFDFIAQYDVTLIETPLLP